MRAHRRKAARFAVATAFALTFLGRVNPVSAQESQRPPPNNVEYFQYGVGLAVEQLASGGDVCPARATTPCILGSGGGLAIRMGYRSRGPWYLGGAYEFSRQDSSNLLRLAILQQLRGEARYYLDAGNRLTPYGAAGFGGVFYGNEWNVSTAGPTLSAGLGLEFQITQSTVIGGSLNYRAFLMHAWKDSTGQDRADRYLGFGLAHMIGFELTLELRDPLARW
ncbi:MAG TPA: outer membrane beta-barrel protein [Polyangiaceae bacterium]|nr:outer membrane beta-barrel protein [Polyangiaceae bacterium]